MKIINIFLAILLKFVKLKLNRIEQNRIAMLDKLTLVNSRHTVRMYTVKLINVE